MLYYVAHTAPQGKLAPFKVIALPGEPADWGMIAEGPFVSRQAAYRVLRSVCRRYHKAWEQAKS